MESTETEMEQDTVDSSSATKACNKFKKKSEGHHMIFMRNALDKTVKKCLSAHTARYSVFASKFKTIAENHPEALEITFKQFVQQLKVTIEEEICTLFEEENIVCLMNTLEDLIQKSDPGQLAWRPSGNVPNDLRAHIQPEKVKQRQRLQKLADQLEEENTKLRESVDAARKQFLDTQKSIQTQFTRTEEAHAVIQDLPLTKFQDFVKE